MYEVLAKTKISEGWFGFGDELTVSFDPDRKYLKITVSENGKILDEHELVFAGNKTSKRIVTYEDVLRNTALSLAAEVDELRDKLKENA